MSGETAAAGHNGDIWPRPPTKHGPILTEKNQSFLFDISIAKKTAPCAEKGRERMKNDRMNSDLYLGMGVGLAVGVVSTLLMRPKKKDVKSAVARVIGDMADSVSKNMGW